MPAGTYVWPNLYAIMTYSGNWECPLQVSDAHAHALRCSHNNHRLLVCLRVVVVVQCLRWCEVYVYSVRAMYFSKI